jgi:hypothetical protein
VVALRWDDIDLTMGRLHVRRATGGDAKRASKQRSSAGSGLAQPALSAPSDIRRRRWRDLAPVLRDLQRQGLSLRGIGAELTNRKVPTLRGGAWHPQLVARVLQRIQAV